MTHRVYITFERNISTGRTFYNTETSDDFLYVTADCPSTVDAQNSEVTKRNTKTLRNLET